MLLTIIKNFKNLCYQLYCGYERHLNRNNIYFVAIYLYCHVGGVSDEPSWFLAAAKFNHKVFLHLRTMMVLHAHSGGKVRKTIETNVNFFAL